MPKAKITYRLLEANEYKYARQLNKNISGESFAVGFPTVGAIKGDKLIGFFATTPHDKYILAGPLVVSKSVSTRVKVNLVEAYERFLSLAQVQSYIFFIDKSDTEWVTALTKLGMKPYTEQEGKLFYVRRLV